MKGQIIDISLDYATRKPKISILLDQNAGFIDEVSKLKDKPVNIDIKAYREKRSKTSNAYMWELISKLQEKMNELPKYAKLTKEEIYQEYIKKYGKSVDYELINDAVKPMTAVWNAYGLGWFTELIDSNSEKSIVRFYYGSSCYKTKRMSILIDAVVQDCKALEIETMTPQEILQLECMANE